jgi:hypothetical protein
MWEVETELLHIILMNLVLFEAHLIVLNFLKPSKVSGRLTCMYKIL